MPDPTMSEAMREAYAIAPSSRFVIDTIELRHPSFVDDDGATDSIWLTTDGKDVTARLEATAPVKPGQQVIFRSFGFKFRLARVEPGTGAELDVQVDNVDRRIAQAINKASKGFVKTMMCYRAWMSDDLEVPSMMPRAFVLSECSADSLTVTAKARVAIDLAGAFPRRLYTATEYPGLLGL
jgi:hypothetical protein